MVGPVPSVWDASGGLFRRRLLRAVIRQYLLRKRLQPRWSGKVENRDDAYAVLVTAALLPCRRGGERPEAIAARDAQPPVISAERDGGGIPAGWDEALYRVAIIRLDDRDSIVRSIGDVNGLAIPAQRQRVRSTIKYRPHSSGGAVRSGDQGPRAKFAGRAYRRSLRLSGCCWTCSESQGLGLENTGVQLDDRGYIRVNDRLQTIAPGIWAMGECAGSPHFTHVSFDDFRIVHDNLTGGNRTTRGRLAPFCPFTDPELARIGLSESEAQKLAIPYRLTRMPMAAVLRTRTLSETRGFMKALISEDTDEILGFTAFGTQAGELMAMVQIAMLAKLPHTALRDAVLTHPTMAEGLTSLFGAVPARSSMGAADRPG
jgi:Pyridine nucleotide-disulphide oxidoreductase, dimerisation domain/Pyridine nucleotide-disulphide oxidoreductase